MTSLHLVHAGEGALTTCLATARPNDAIVLLEDAAYAAVIRERLPANAGYRYFVIEDHIVERGIDDRLAAARGAPKVSRINWHQLVELVVACERSITWV